VFTFILQAGKIKAPVSGKPHGDVGVTPATFKGPPKRDDTGGFKRPASAQTLILAAVSCQSLE
jgi:hypothetical protein